MAASRWDAISAPRSLSSRLARNTAKARFQARTGRIHHFSTPSDRNARTRPMTPVNLRQ